MWRPMEAPLENLLVNLGSGGGKSSSFGASSSSSSNSLQVVAIFSLERRTLSSVVARYRRRPVVAPSSSLALPGWGLLRNRCSVTNHRAKITKIVTRTPNAFRIITRLGRDPLPVVRWILRIKCWLRVRIPEMEVPIKVFVLKNETRIFC